MKSMTTTNAAERSGYYIRGFLMDAISMCLGTNRIRQYPPNTTNLFIFDIHGSVHRSMIQ